MGYKKFPFSEKREYIEIQVAYQYCCLFFATGPFL